MLNARFEQMMKNADLTPELKDRAAQAQKKCRMFPKMHYLLHTGDFLRRHGFWGKVSEQCVESLHAIFNNIVCLFSFSIFIFTFFQEVRYRNTKMRRKQLEKICRHHFVLNYLFDNGFFQCIDDF